MPRTPIIEHVCDGIGACKCRHRLTRAEAKRRVNAQAAFWIDEYAIWRSISEKSERHSPCTLLFSTILKAAGCDRLARQHVNAYGQLNSEQLAWTGVATPEFKALGKTVTDTTLRLIADTGMLRHRRDDTP
jgi:hypothetical protein